MSYERNKSNVKNIKTGDSFMYTILFCNLNDIEEKNINDRAEGANF